MPANATGWFFHALARETGRLGHLYSPRGERGPWPWFPYALDNGAFSFWNQDANEFDHDAWMGVGQLAWQRLIFWSHVSKWAAAFPRVHLLRCNAPTKFYELEALGIESTDGTGWNRGDRKQTAGLEEWARSSAAPITSPLWPYVCRSKKNPEQESFA